MRTSSLPSDAGALPLSRRALLRQSVIGGLATAMAIPVGGQLLSPAEARAQGVPLSVFSAEQAATLEALGDILLPGASTAGIAQFVDHQLTKQTPLLMIRYFDWPGPLIEFYTGGLAALDGASITQHGAPFAKSTPAQQNLMVFHMFGGQVDGWNGPPPPLVYLAVRGDAVDVVYGTVDGFAKLDIPYLPHILPQQKW